MKHQIKLVGTSHVLKSREKLVYCARLKQGFQQIAKHQINRTYRPNWLPQWLQSVPKLFSVLGAIDSRFFFSTRSNYERDTASTRHLFFVVNTKLDLNTGSYPTCLHQIIFICEKNIDSTKCMVNGITFDIYHYRLNSRDRGCLCRWSTVFKKEKKKEGYSMQKNQEQINGHSILPLEMCIVNKAMHDASLIHLQGIR